MNKAIKSCPFCGSDIITELEHDYEGDVFYSRDCTRCGASSNWFSIRKQATEAWNTRAREAKLVEALEYILEHECDRGLIELVRRVLNGNN